MYKKFRETHLFAFLNRLEQDTLPLDAALSNYLRAHKSIGAHDRRFLGDTVYSMIRWKSALDALAGPNASWEQRYLIWQSPHFSDRLKTLPSSLQCGASPWLYEECVKAYGEERAFSLLSSLNEPAPLTIRVNLLKISREDLLSSFSRRFRVSPCEQSKAGIRFEEKTPLTALPEFKKGFFEIQDEGSQLLADLVRPLPGEQLLDFCSGSGGKSLAIAPCMQGKGQIYLHDIRPYILIEARRRFRRAGVQNAQFLPPSHPRLSSLKEKIDWVLADVPCSGSGTFRRNPDMKWKCDASLVKRLAETQREIVAQAVQFVKPGGWLVYGTCSLFPEENERQVNFFLNTLPLSLVSPLFHTHPTPKGPDGFFAAVFRKTGGAV